MSDTGRSAFQEEKHPVAHCLEQVGYGSEMQHGEIRLHTITERDVRYARPKDHDGNFLSRSDQVRAQNTTSAARPFDFESLKSEVRGDGIWHRSQLSYVLS